MRSKIKELIPKPIKNLLRPLKQKLVDNPRKRLLFLQMRKKHEQFIQQIKGKEKIKIVFLAIHKSVWKVDPVFKKMLDDPFFEPLILVCPYTIYGEERMKEDMKDTYEYFEDKGYPLLSSYNKDENRWLSLEEIKPDIIFFTNPHNLTRKEYYEDAYINYLSCYVPYAHDVSRYDNFQSQYNQNFHNCVWRIFAPHKEDLEIFKNYSISKDKNVIVTGYPFCEVFINAKIKHNKHRKIIIWAPHHTIDDNDVLGYSNFIQYSSLFKEIATNYQNDITLVFKPHPILKSKLYKHENWGIAKTDSYYRFWETQINTSFNDGEYINLFIESDAMIHDSGSFLAEYMYLKKPVLYLNNREDNLNEFGIKAKNSTTVGKNKADIILFIENVINENASVDIDFYKKSLLPYFQNNLPSVKIVNHLKNLKEH